MDTFPQPPGVRALLLDHDVPLADDVQPVAKFAFEEATKVAGIREAQLQIVIQV